MGSSLSVAGAGHSLASGERRGRSETDSTRPRSAIRTTTPARPVRFVVDGRGNAYVNSVGDDMMAGEAGRPGHVVLVADGTVRRVAEDLAFPNGMAVTPDNATLIVAESHGNRLTAFDIGGDGDPTGICVDAEGAVQGRHRGRGHRRRGFIADLMIAALLPRSG